MEGKKRAILKARPFAIAGEWLAIVQDQELLGVARFSSPIEIPRDKAAEFFPLHQVSEEEINKWWPEADKLYLYVVEEVRAYPTPIRIDVPPGVQTFLSEVQLPHRELLKSESLTIEVLGVFGLVDRPGARASILLKEKGFRLRLDKGSDDREADAVVISHAHPDHIEGLRKDDVIFAGPETARQLRELGYKVTEIPSLGSRKIGPFTVSVCPVLHSVRAPTYAIRVESENGAIVWAPDILGFYDKDERNIFLDGADILFVDGSHPAGIVRRADDQPIGHVAWSTAVSWAKKAGIKRVVFIHFGEAPVELEKAELEEILAELQAKYGIPCELAKEGQVFQLVKKLDLERFRSGELDRDLEHPEGRWRELLRDHQLLHIGYYRLKRGEAWGEWTEEDIIRYHAKVVDALRRLYFPMLPEAPEPDGGLSAWKAELDRLSERFEETRPPREDELPEWDAKRAEILKSDLAELHASLPSSFLVCPEWASLTGSLVYGQHPPRDIDVILKLSAPSGSLLKLQRALQERIALPVQFSLDAAGPTWDYVPLYDLVAVKRPFELVRVNESLETRARLYKAMVESDPKELRPDRPFVHYGVAGEFYIPHELELAWEKWARRQVERGVQVAIQPKFDGIRLLIGKRGRKLWVWTERGRDVSGNFPGLAKALAKLGNSLMLDCEFVEFESGEFERQVSRTQMTWMATAKAPKEDAKIKIFVHDIMYLNGENLTDLPYFERFRILAQLIKKPILAGNYLVELAETYFVSSFAEFKSAIEEVSRWKPGRSTEGAMLKAADFRYVPQEARGLVVKLKNRIEIDCLILGYRRMPKPKPPNVKWTEEEAKSNLGWTDTYIFRVALRDEASGKYVPIEAKKKLTERDLRFTWNEEKGTWEGTDDPSIWTMFWDLPHRGPGEYAYGNSYAVKTDMKPKPGMVLTVAPMEMTYFEDEDGLHVTWQHPIPVGLKERGSPVSTVQAAFAAHRKDLPKRKFAVLLDLS